MSTSRFALIVAAASFCAQAGASVVAGTESARLQDFRTLTYGSSTWSVTQAPSYSFVGPVYDSTNFTTSGATGFGVGATSSTDLAATYGDQANMVGAAGSTLDSLKFALFCSGSSANALTSATVTLRFYRQSNSSYIGGLSVSVGSLGKGFYSVYTVNSLASLGINFDTDNILVTQQLSNVVGATRMGTVFSNASNTPALGSTNAGLYMSNSTTTAGFYTFTGFSSFSSGAYQMSTVPAPGALALLGVASLVSTRRRR